MADVHDQKTRSYNMSRIKGKNTKPEMLVRKYLFSKGFRYSLHNAKMTGKPDIILPKYRTLIFVNGCFWHGHKQCKSFVIPKTNTEWWMNKIGKNIERDIKVKRILKKEGWKIINVWECQLKPSFVEKTLTKLPGKIVPSNL